MRKLLLVLCVVFLITVCGACGLPNLGDIAGLDRLMNANNDSITTSISDAVTEVPFLDDYNPKRGALIGLLPRGAKGTTILLPGIWEGTFRSYCLHMGTHGPTQGDGYLYAPLKGPKAPIIQHILQNSVSHPEIPQNHVQVLIWAILARTKISDAPPEIQQAAQMLMTKGEIDQCNGGALGKIPPDVLNQVMGNLPPVARQVMQAEDTIRGMLAGASNVSYQQLERVAVLQGEVAPPQGSREVPGGRWSYHPEGFFVRFFPSSYATTRTQYYSPEQIKVEADGQGRITAIEDPQGVRVETRYDDGAGALTFDGDAGIKGHALKSIKIIGPDPAKPGQSRRVDVTGAGWVLVGTPRGKGKAEAPGARFTGAQARYDWAMDGLVKLSALNAVIGKVHPKRTAPKPKDLASLVDLASYAQGLKLALAGQGADARWKTEQIGVVYRMWMSAVVELSEQPMRTATETRLASAGEFRLADVSPITPIQRLGHYGGHDSSGGTASPGNTGKQRLAQSGGKIGGSENGSDTMAKAESANKAISLGTSAVEFGHGLSEGAFGLSPYEIPEQLVDRMLDELYDLYGKAMEALQGDPPRDDYQLIATAEKAKFTPVKARAKLSQARADAFNAFMDAALDLAAKLRAVKISLDRYGGAISARDEVAADRQVRNVAKWERPSGFAMLIVADRMEALVKVCRNEGYKFPVVTAEAVKAYQVQLRAKGYSANAIAAARAIGLTDQEIEEARQTRLKVAPEDATGSLDKLAAHFADGLRELGKDLILVPVIDGG